MEYKSDFFDKENIPDFALQPAKPTSAFDPTVYDKLFETLKQSDKTEVQAEARAEDTPTVQTEEPEPAVEIVAAELPKAEVPEPVSIEVADAEAKAETETETDAAEDEVAVAVDSEALSGAVLPEPDQPDRPDQPDQNVVLADSPEIRPIPSRVIEIDPERKSKAASVPKPTQPSHKSVYKADKKADNKIAELPVSQSLSQPSGQQNKKIKFTGFRINDPITINVEEDILIADTKPDMVQILNVEGSCRLTERNVSVGAQAAQPLRISGDLAIKVLYVAENDKEEPIIVSLESKTPFREDTSIKTLSNSTLAMSADISKIQCEKINERKFKMSAVIEVCAKEYYQDELQLFEGLDNEDLQLLHEEIEFVDVAIRKAEIIEISEEIKLREDAPEIDKILCYNVNLAENHKQIGGEKAMINAVAYIDLLYRNADGTTFYKCKTDFTQFMKMKEGEFNYPLIAGRTNFDILNCSITAKRDDEGYSNILCLDMEVETTIEYYRRIQEPCIVDLYHYTKDVECEKTHKELNKFCGTGDIDITVREIVDIPEAYGSAEQVVYISGVPSITNRNCLQDRIMVEGTLPVKLVCIGGESGKLPFTIDSDLEFRAVLDLPDCKEGMEPDCKVTIKDFGFDRINNKQIAVNAEMGISGIVFEKTSDELIHTVNIIEKEGTSGPDPAIIVYATKDGDSIWKVAKKYRTPINRLRAVNDLDDHEEIVPGSKVLIVKM